MAVVFLVRAAHVFVVPSVGVVVRRLLDLVLGHLDVYGRDHALLLEETVTGRDLISRDVRNQGLFRLPARVHQRRNRHDPYVCCPVAHLRETRRMRVPRSASNYRRMCSSRTPATWTTRSRSFSC